MLCQKTQFKLLNMSLKAIVNSGWFKQGQFGSEISKFNRI